ncbi:DUF6622 family protein [Pelistega europaea]|uniref:DUF1453 domain-containing protein n=1 Tax=Pelistega europaea TaxID=106147 RepID=A0A7Y4P5K8_9BURK|nr:DUF6622 family protein [Pelistega europaea]NOL48840.1 hypothetical protein [Pelistega europaea]
MLDIITHTPYWVWGLLIFLLVIGSLSLKDRTIPVYRVMPLPIIFSFLSFFSIISMYSGELLLSAMIANFIFLVVGVLIVEKILISMGIRVVYHRSERRLFISGNGFTLVSVILIFLVKYVLNVFLVIKHPSLTDDFSFAIIFGAIQGICASVFLGELLYFYKKTR